MMMRVSYVSLCAAAGVANGQFLAAPVNAPVTSFVRPAAVHVGFSASTVGVGGIAAPPTAEAVAKASPFVINDVSVSTQVRNRNSLKALGSASFNSIAESQRIGISGSSGSAADKASALGPQTIGALALAGSVVLAVVGSRWRRKRVAAVQPDKVEMRTMFASKLAMAAFAGETSAALLNQAAAKISSAKANQSTNESSGIPPSTVRRVLVTGGNQGIGFAVCKQLAIEHNCHVYLAARNPDKGQTAASTIGSLIQDTPACTGSVDFIPIDTSSESSIQKAAEKVSSMLVDSKLDAIVNNAGIGLNTGSSGDILTTNLYGPKRVSEHFLDLLDPNNGRIVNLGSGSGPMYVSGCSEADKKILCGPESDALTWEFIEQHARDNQDRSNTYGLSKALLACYTGLFARQHPKIITSCVSPGFIDTQMTAGYGASKTPEQGTLAIKKCLFEDLPGNGWYYGSDGLRSPYHYMRNPGEPVYDGVNPFL